MIDGPTEPLGELVAIEVLAVALILLLVGNTTIRSASNVLSASSIAV